MEESDLDEYDFEVSGFITNEVLNFLHEEACNKKSAAKKKSSVRPTVEFWRNLLVDNFRMDDYYLVSTYEPLEMSDNTMSGLIVKHIGLHNSIRILVQAIQPGLPVQQGQENLRNEVEDVFQRDEDLHAMFGMTVQGTAALCWRFERGLHGMAVASPVGGGRKRDYRDRYIQVGGPHLRYIKEFFSLIKGDDATDDATQGGSFRRTVWDYSVV